ncbi:hypothetical protein NSK_001345 [Nannochloropsis salina CCMP1776]|uniref:RRM domain-containing protein n=1 Tax=Nannochloropsis salina CCMP1776 TaxID=1027361 RepID=A0A4D9D5L6_9STRA|nr:hypothetical protein NSK_001345 [Nannochloropsis salina CCMP1776]|eukprot:TFJ87011.1 hypothetical protein NSK_001345 [Nannochloropsis salina CCMP1776]
MGGTEEQCKTLWVGDIQPSWDEAYVGSVFANTGLEEGDVVEVKLIRDKHTGFPAGYGFVEFATAEIAEKVLETCNGNAIAGTHFRFRLNWGAGGKRMETAPEFSIFVGDLAPEVTDQMLQDIFLEKFPSTLGAKVVMDPVSGMSKGFGFVRFKNEEEKEEALSTMTGVGCGGRAIRVAPATAKKAAGSHGLGMGAGMMMGMHVSPYPGMHPHMMLGGDGEDPHNTTVFVGGIDAGVTEDVLREAFSEYGDIIYVKIPPGRGCGFVQYVNRTSAETAIAKMQGVDVRGCKVRLSWGRSSPARAEGRRMGGMGGGMEGGMGMAGYPAMYTTVGPGAGGGGYYPPTSHLHPPHPQHPPTHSPQAPPTPSGYHYAPGPIPYPPSSSPYLPPYHPQQPSPAQAASLYHPSQGGGGSHPYTHLSYSYQSHLHAPPHSLPPLAPGQDRGGYPPGGVLPAREPRREGGREGGVADPVLWRSRAQSAAPAVGTGGAEGGEDGGGGGKEG